MHGRRILLIVLFAGCVSGVSLAAPQSKVVQDKDFVYNDHGTRDPFWRLVSPNGVILTHENDLTAADLVLEGILIDENGKSIAIINGRVVKEKGILGAFTVQKITTDSVVLHKGPEFIVLKLKKEE